MAKNRIEVNSIDKEGKEKTVFVKIPDSQDNKEAQLAYNKAFREALQSGAVLRQKLEKIMEEQGIWDAERQNKHDQILNDNDASIMAEINAMKAQLQALVAQVAEKDKRIAELEQVGGGQSLEQVLEQVRDARAGSVVLTVDPEGDTVTLGLTIEQSDNLIEWTKLDGEMTRTIPIPDGKKFYRFALDK